MDSLPSDTKFSTKLERENKGGMELNWRRASWRGLGLENIYINLLFIIKQNLDPLQESDSKFYRIRGDTRVEKG